MSALDEIAKLKAARRAEIAAAAAERQRAEEAARIEFARRLEESIARLLDEQSVPYLAEFRIGDPNVWDRNSCAEVRFELPGHRVRR